MQVALKLRHAAVALSLLLEAAPVHAAESLPPCPPSPIRVVHSGGEPTTYTGAYPGIAELCHLGPTGAEDTSTTVSGT